MNGNCKKPESIKSNQVISLQSSQPIDWDQLFDQWLKSNLPRAQFLRAKGMDPTNPTVKQRTRAWNRNRGDTKKIIENLKEATDGLSAEIQLNADYAPEDMKSSDSRTLWGIVQTFRKHQFFKDYRTADKIREHITLMLNQHMKGLMDPEGKKTTLKAIDIKHLSEALAQLQKVQRLAIGLSTDNIGVSVDDDTAGDNTVEPSANNDGPIFVVEVLDNGRFKQARPRQVG